jgi:hypothetical protein
MIFDFLDLQDLTGFPFCEVEVLEVRRRSFDALDRPQLLPFSPCAPVFGPQSLTPNLHTPRCPP